jgi:hypothetical protein
MSIISGSWGIMVFRLDIEIYVLGKCGTKRGQEKEKMGRRCTGTAGFCSPYACLDIFLLL